MNAQLKATMDRYEKRKAARDRRTLEKLSKEDRKQLSMWRKHVNQYEVTAAKIVTFKDPTCYAFAYADKTCHSPKAYRVQCGGCVSDRRFFDHNIKLIRLAIRLRNQRIAAQ